MFTHSVPAYRSAAPAKSDLPAIDVAAPANVESATFATG